MKEAEDKKKNKKQERKAIIHLILDSPKILFAVDLVFVLFAYLQGKTIIADLSPTKKEAEALKDLISLFKTLAGEI